MWLVVAVPAAQGVVAGVGKKEQDFYLPTAFVLAA
jgi:hypothetical protein